MKHKHQWPGLLFLATLLFLSHTEAFAQDKLSDAEVAFVAVTANQIDIDFAEIAKKKSKDGEVIKFAETMARDHKAVIAQAAALAKKLGVTPKDNDVSKKMMSDARNTMKDLRAKSGEDFNKAYINNEVAYHQAVINAVESVLIPETENSELKQLLQDVLPALKAHLEHAQMLKNGLH